MHFFLTYWSFGVLYTYLFPLFGGWFSHFVFRFSVLHSLLFGVLAAVVAVSLQWLSPASDRVRNRLHLVISGLFSVHFLGWLFTLSNMEDGELWVLVVAAAGGVAVIFFTSWMAQKLSATPLFSLVIFLVIGLAGIGLKGLIVQRLPLSVVGDHVNGNLASTELEARDIVYPLSMPLDESLSRYSAVLPEIKPEKSIQMIILDALRKDYVGSTLHGRKVTPNIDGIRKDGFALDRYYVQAPWTKGSTASLFTGRYPHNHGVCTPTKNYGQVLPDRYNTIAERLRGAGFKTFGAAFVVHLNSRFGFGQGFDLWVSNDKHFNSDNTAMQKILLKILRERPKKLFVYLHTLGPHSPYKAALLNVPFWKTTPYYEKGNIRFPNWELPHPREFTRAAFDDFKKANPSFYLSADEIKVLRYLYNAQLNFYDRYYVGRYVRALRALGLYKSSLVTVTGDHGEDLFDLGFSHGHYAQRHIGHLSNLRELVVNVPMVTKPPRGIDPAGNYPEGPGIVESVDYTATLAEYAGVSRRGFQGDSFYSYLKKGRTTPGTTFNHALSEICRIGRAKASPGKRRVKQKIEEKLTTEQLKRRLRIVEAVFVKERWKLAASYFRNEFFLYDLKNDPKERTPVTDRPKLKNRLRASLLEAMGGDTTVKNVPGSFKPMTAEEKDQMKGLGYVQ